MVRDDDPEEQPEADDVQADDRGGQAAGPRPLGRAQRAAHARRSRVALRRARGAQPGEREVREARAVADGVEHGRAHGVELGGRDGARPRRTTRSTTNSRSRPAGW